MRSRSDELCSPAAPVNPRGWWAPEGDPYDHPPSSLSSSTILPQAGLAFSGDINPAECGGAPSTPSPGCPCGSSARPNAGEDGACRHSPPCQSPSTLCPGGVGTNDNISNVVSGGFHPDPLSDVPCGRSTFTLVHDQEGNACRSVPYSKPPLTLSPRCMCRPNTILYDVSGGSSLPPFHEFDGSLQTLPQPLSPPMPPTAAIHDHGHVSALLRVSVSRVNSTPKHGDGSGRNPAHDAVDAEPALLLHLGDAAVVSNCQYMRACMQAVASTTATTQLPAATRQTSAQNMMQGLIERGKIATAQLSGAPRVCALPQSATASASQCMRACLHADAGTAASEQLPAATRQTFVQIGMQGLIKHLKIAISQLSGVYGVCAIPPSATASADRFMRACLQADASTTASEQLPAYTRQTFTQIVIQGWHELAQEHKSAHAEPAPLLQRLDAAAGSNCPCSCSCSYAVALRLSQLGCSLLEMSFPNNSLPVYVDWDLHPMQMSLSELRQPPIAAACATCMFKGQCLCSCLYAITLRLSQLGCGSGLLEMSSPHHSPSVCAGWDLHPIWKSLSELRQPSTVVVCTMHMYNHFYMYVNGTTTAIEECNHHEAYPSPRLQHIDVSNCIILTQPATQLWIWPLSACRRPWW